MNGADQQPNGADLELAAIQREAAALETEQRIELNPDDPAAQPPAPVDHTAEARELIDFAHAALVPLYPSLDKVYTDDVRQRIAVAGGRLLKKYNVDMAALFGEWGEEIGFALVALPLIVPTVQAIRADREAAAKAPATMAGAGYDPKSDYPGRNPPDMATRAEDPPPAGPNPLHRFGQ